MSCPVLIKEGRECSREGKYAGCCHQHAMKKLEENISDTRLVKVEKATDNKHKFVAVFESDGRQKHVPFGSYGMNDFTLTKDKSQRDSYRTRHSKDLSTLDPTKPGYLSYYILWGDSTDINENIKKYKKMFTL